MESRLVPCWGRCFQVPPGSSSALGRGDFCLVGQCPPEHLTKWVCTRGCALSLSYCADGNRSSGFSPNWSSKGVSMEHGQPWRHPGLPSQALLHPMRFPSPTLYWLHLPEALLFLTAKLPRRCPTREKPACGLSKLQTHLPALLQPRNLHHLLNHVYEWGEKH